MLSVDSCKQPFTFTKLVQAPRPDHKAPESDTGSQRRLRASKSLVLLVPLLLYGGQCVVPARRSCQFVDISSKMEQNVRRDLAATLPCGLLAQQPTRSCALQALNGTRQTPPVEILPKDLLCHSICLKASGRNTAGSQRGRYFQVSQSRPSFQLVFAPLAIARAAQRQMLASTRKTFASPLLS